MFFRNKLDLVDDSLCREIVVQFRWIRELK